MNILIDIGHPAHVHLFKNFAKEMMAKGNKVLFTCREKEFEINLLKSNGLDYISFGKKYKSLTGKIWGMIKFDIMECKVALNFKPDVFLSHGSLYAAFASFLVHKPHIALEDTGNMEQVRLYLPFTDALLTPDSVYFSNLKGQIKYPSYHEMAYIHHKYFVSKGTGQSILGLRENEKYFILRFVAWNATHDVGLKGLSLDEKYKIVEYLSKKGRVFISSEGVLPKDLEQYKISIDPNKMHDILKDASLLFTEGGTMASEAGILGTPTIFVCSSINTPIAAVLRKQNEEGIIIAFDSFSNEVMSNVEKIVENQLSKVSWGNNVLKILENKINLTDFLVWFVTNWPDSKTKISNNNQLFNNYNQ